MRRRRDPSPDPAKGRSRPSCRSSSRESEMETPGRAKNHVDPGGDPEKTKMRSDNDVDSPGSAHPPDPGDAIDRVPRPPTRQLCQRHLTPLFDESVVYRQHRAGTFVEQQQVMPALG